MTVKLDTLQGCLEELEACSNGLLYFDHLYGRVLDNIRERGAVWSTVESEALREVREDNPGVKVAREINGLVTHWVEQRPSKRKAWDELRESEAQKEKIERWTRTLEKRIGSAQTAKGIHEQLAHGGGG